jgi:hypothetical protein
VQRGSALRICFEPGVPLLRTGGVVGEGDVAVKISSGEVRRAGNSERRSGDGVWGGRTWSDGRLVLLEPFWLVLLLMGADIVKA